MMKKCSGVSEISQCLSAVCRVLLVIANSSSRCLLLFWKIIHWIQALLIATMIWNFVYRMKYVVGRVANVRIMNFWQMRQHVLTAATVGGQQRIAKAVLTWHVPIWNIWGGHPGTFRFLPHFTDAESAPYVTSHLLFKVFHSTCCVCRYWYLLNDCCNCSISEVRNVAFIDVLLETNPNTWSRVW